MGVLCATAEKTGLLKKKLENVAIANALQLEAARRRAVPIRFKTSPVASFKHEAGYAGPRGTPATLNLTHIRLPLVEVAPPTEDAQETEVAQQSEAVQEAEAAQAAGSRDPGPGVADSRAPIPLGSIQPPLAIRHPTKIRLKPTSVSTHRIQISRIYSNAITKVPDWRMPEETGNSCLAKLTRISIGP